jgi:2',3'-cyclic-nucleotide 2'-phosphodiesterase (5'-nucleotidase family)
MSVVRHRLASRLTAMGFIALAALGAAAQAARHNPRPAPNPNLATQAKAEDSKETSGYGPAQDAADALRDFTSSDGAFLAAGLIKDGYKKTEDLAEMLLYPQDEVLVLKLTGAQIKAAFERSVSLFPQPNTSFLQISGFDVSFSKTAEPGSRVLSVRAGGAALDSAHVYTVAMPASLGRGGLGYFKIWDTPNIAKTYSQSVESVLKGKKPSGSSPRWSPSG